MPEVVCKSPNDLAICGPGRSTSHTLTKPYPYAHGWPTPRILASLTLWVIAPTRLGYRYNLLAVGWRDPPGVAFAQFVARKLLYVEVGLSLATFIATRMQKSLTQAPGPVATLLTRSTELPLCAFRYLEMRYPSFAMQFAPNPVRNGYSKLRGALIKRSELIDYSLCLLETTRQTRLLHFPSDW